MEMNQGAPVALRRILFWMIMSFLMFDLALVAQMGAAYVMSGRMMDL